MMSAKFKIFAFFYKYIFKKIFFLFDPEFVHDLVTWLGRILGSNLITRRIIGVFFNFQHPALRQNILGIEFKNPLGLAAGFDKEGQLTNVLPEVGFGFEEVGFITAKAYEGNPKPRLYRLPHTWALRVNYGLKSSGADNIFNRLSRIQTHFPIGISIAKTNHERTSQVEAGIEDYLYTYKKFSDIGQYVTINISCPNTCEKSPIFAKAENLDLLLAALFKVPKTKPVFVKLSPDLTDEDLNAILNVCTKHPVDGFVCTNLTKENSVNHEGKGGFSGKMVEGLSNSQIGKVYRFFGGQKVIIGCGGVFSAEDAYKKICSGASLIQLITGMVYQGPQVIGQINQGLVELLKKDGLNNISEAVGKDVLPEGHPQGKVFP